jgi:hypothetical protein
MVDVPRRVGESQADRDARIADLASLKDRRLANAMRPVDRFALAAMQSLIEPNTDFAVRTPALIAADAYAMGLAMAIVKTVTS